MNKIGFLLSGLLTLIGFFTLNFTSFTNKLLPKIGKMIYQLSTFGSYTPSDYKIAFASTNTLALFEIIIGLGLCVLFYWKSSRAD